MYSTSLENKREGGAICFSNAWAEIYRKKGRVFSSTLHRNFRFKLESRAYQPKVNVQVHVLSEVQSGELTKELSIDKSVVLGE